jgi:hypothetical protein
MCPLGSPYACCMGSWLMGTLVRQVRASASVQDDSPVPSMTLVSASHWADDLRRYASCAPLRVPARSLQYFSGDQFYLATHAQMRTYVLHPLSSARLSKEGAVGRC